MANKKRGVKTPPQTVGFMLSDVARLLRSNFDRRVQELNLTQPQWQALTYLARNEGAQQSALAEMLGKQPMSVARLIDRMESTGWVERRPDPSDRRAFNLHLTEKVDPVLEEIWKHAARTRSQALAGISDRDRKKLLQILSVMRRNLIDGANERKRNGHG